jgi:phosphoribosyl-ATP pyrophosphohydrolase/phosphoribosyl-AMP cyclohydrolase
MPPLPLKFDAQGLVPAVVQDYLTGQIRMFAFASNTAVRKTLETGLATFWSRSRGELWQRGRVGGQETAVVRVFADCDADCIIYSSDPHSPSCHSGAPSCFFHALEGDRLVQASEQPQTLLAFLESSLVSGGKSAATSESSSPPEGQGNGLGSRVLDDARDLARALDEEGDERVVYHAADMLYRLVVSLRARSISVRQVLGELARRLGHGDARAASRND